MTRDWIKELYIKEMVEKKNSTNTPSLKSNKNNMKQVLHFTSSTCAPCKMVAPIIEELKSEMNIKTISINDSLGKELASEHNVRSVPTTIFLKNNTEINRVIGAQPKNSYKQYYDSL